MLQKDIKAYIKGYDIYLASKVICYKLCSDLQLLPILTYWWKDLSIDFITGLLVSTNWKGKSYNIILVIIDQLTKMVHYNLVKVTIDIPGLAKMIIDMVVYHHRVSQSIVTNQGSFFISKFWFSLYYFLDIKKQLYIAFHL